jgi:TorA maturation chaperone TorD
LEGRTINKIDAALESRKNFYEFLSEVYSKGVPRKFIEDVKTEVFSIPHTENKDVETGFREIFDYINKHPLGIEELVRDIDEEYVRLFLGPGKAEVLPYQSPYEGHVIYGETTLKLKNIFTRAGLRITGEAGIGEDHLGAELKFMAYLCGRAMDMLAQEKDITATLELQKKFLGENMLPWVQKFCEDVLKSRKANFYRGIVMVTRGFLKEDRALLYELLARL